MKISPYLAQSLPDIARSLINYIRSHIAPEYGLAVLIIASILLLLFFVSRLFSKSARIADAIARSLEALLLGAGENSRKLFRAMLCIFLASGVLYSATTIDDEPFIKPVLFIFAVTLFGVGIIMAVSKEK